MKCPSTQGASDQPFAQDYSTLARGVRLSPCGLPRASKKGFSHKWGSLFTRRMVEAAGVEPVADRMNKGLKGWWHHVGTTEEYR